MKKIIIPLFVLGMFLLTSELFAGGSDNKNTTDAVYLNAGNSWRLINVRQSTSSVVLISSAPTDIVESSITNNIGITEWRERFIINCSTDSNLMLYPNKTGYITYISTSGGIILSTSGYLLPCVSNTGNSIIIRHQGSIWGIWGGNSGIDTSGSKGFAGGYETYYKK